MDFKEITKNNNPIKSVFASASEHPCPPQYKNLFLDFEDEESTPVSLIKPEPNCKRMYDYFKRTGLPSLIEPIDSFELPYDVVFESVGVNKKIKEIVDPDTIDEAKLNSLIWGN